MVEGSGEPHRGTGLRNSGAGVQPGMKGPAAAPEDKECWGDTSPCVSDDRVTWSRLCPVVGTLVCVGEDRGLRGS